MTRATAIERYLQRYAEPETALAESVDRHFDQVLVVPCYNEAENFLSNLAVPGGHRTLKIVVVNMPDTAAEQTAAQNHHLLAALQQRATPDLMILDRVSKPIPHRQGVGLARKVGADLALALIAAGKVSRPWIYFSDADAHLPENYFTTTLPETGSALFGFRHHSLDAQVQRRATLYELHLRYYAWQLQRAGSTYGFITLGSTMAVAARSYAEVRGVPRRNAAEDFYLLNKLAKVAPVNILTRPVVTLTARLSDRVPFGTGPALRKIPDDAEAYCSYAPEIFTILAGTLKALHRHADDGSTLELGAAARAALVELAWPAMQSRLAQIPDPQRRQRALREWFDGFRTMRFVRLLAETHPDVPLLANLRSLLSVEPDYSAVQLLLRLIEAEKPVTISPTDLLMGN